jgi:hypothetical protein
MESTLHRDKILLLASIDQMRKTLVVFIHILIERGKAALCENHKMFLDSYQDYPELENAQAQLIVSLDLFRVMKHS